MSHNQAHNNWYGRQRNTRGLCESKRPDHPDPGGRHSDLKCYSLNVILFMKVSSTGLLKRLTFPSCFFLCFFIIEISICLRSACDLLNSDSSYLAWNAHDRLRLYWLCFTVPKWDDMVAFWSFCYIGLHITFLFWVYLYLARFAIRLFVLEKRRVFIFPSTPPSSGFLWTDLHYLQSPAHNETVKYHID